MNQRWKCNYAAMALIMLSILTGCGGESSEKPMSWATAVGTVTEPGSLAQLELPQSAVVVGLHHEGLQAHFKVRMRSDGLQVFLKQRLFADASPPLPIDYEFTSDLSEPWWQPNLRVRSRYELTLPDKRALHISVNEAEPAADGDYVYVYLFRFNA